jgi:hypothetical protein
LRACIIQRSDAHKGIQTSYAPGALEEEEEREEEIWCHSVPCTQLGRVLRIYRVTAVYTEDMRVGGHEYACVHAHVTCTACVSYLLREAHLL